MSTAVGFDANKYLDAQTLAIGKRLERFRANGRLYLEIGGHFLNDGHASRVLPGFEPTCKIELMRRIVQTQNVELQILFCVSARDYLKNRVWVDGETYMETLLRVLKSISELGLGFPIVVINLVRDVEQIAPLEHSLHTNGYTTYRRFWIDGYPNADKAIEGYARDQHVAAKAPLVIVIGLGSNSGKLSTCLGQVYGDRVHEQLDSGYAKYELFPIWDLPLEHPVNMAYEAATVDIGDVVVYDHFHEQHYGVKSVNYNRDVDAFPILHSLIKRVSGPGNPMHEYHSPTDMGVNTAKVGIIDDDVCVQAAIAEIRRRIERHRKLATDGRGSEEWTRMAEAVLTRVLQNEQAKKQHNTINDNNNNNNNSGDQREEKEG